MVSSKVSVVMITYNHGTYLTEAIKGVLAQDCNFEVELIIADDCSLDNPQSIVESFANNKNYKWIKYTRHSSNKGMMANFIWALQQSNGKYIALCEGDDYWTDVYKLQRQVDFLENNPDKSLVCTYYGVQKNVEFTEPNDLQYKEIDSENLLNPYLILTLTVLFHSKVLKGIEYNNFKYFKDNTLYFLCLKFGNGAILPINSATYRKHSGGIWSGGSSLENLMNNLFHFIEIYNLVIKSNDLKYQINRIILKLPFEENVVVSNLFYRISFLGYFLNAFLLDNNISNSKKIKTSLFIFSFGKIKFSKK